MNGANCRIRLARCRLLRVFFSSFAPSMRQCFIEIKKNAPCQIKHSAINELLRPKELDAAAEDLPLLCG